MRSLNKKKCAICGLLFNKSIVYKGLTLCHKCYLDESGVMPYPIEPLGKLLERIMNKDYRVQNNGSVYISKRLRSLKVRIIPVDLLP